MLIHVIFSTKNQKPLITEAIEPLLYDKISKILFDECYSPALIIGGGVEHIHILYAQSRDWSVDAIVNRVKTRSAEFLRKRVADFAWQKGYGAFSIWQSSVLALKRYIRNQRQHHRRVSFEEEYRTFFKRYEVEFDERYVWD